MSVPITRDGPYVAPYAYQLAASESWQALTISATFDGSGASGSFYPCCSIYTQDGKLVSRDFPSTAVDAGSSAEVTYHPFLRGNVSTPTPPAAAGWGYGRFISIDAGSLSGLASGTTTAISFSGRPIVTNDNSTTGTHTTTSSPFTGYHFGVNTATNAFIVSAASEGFYLVHRYFWIQQFSGAPSAAFTMRIIDDGTVPALHRWMLANEPLESNSYMEPDGVSGNYVVRDDTVYAVESSTTFTVGMSVKQTSGLTADTYHAGVAIVWLGDQT